MGILIKLQMEEKTWTTINNGIGSSNEGTFRSGSQLLFVNENIAFVTMPYASGDDSDLYYSEDGGINFTKVTLSDEQIYDYYYLPTIEDGKLITLIGESGCGKTTTLKMLNKLITPTSGEIYIDGKNIKDLNDIDLRRNMGYVIQQTGLFPHMTIKENIEIIAKTEKYSKEKIYKRIKEVLRMVGLKEEMLDRYPSELSGGQQQRIGIARAFMTDPKIILMDEPFSALDPISRASLQEELLKIQSKLHKTIVFVTHDMDEAIKLADKIAIMEQGKLVQYDNPENILKHPANQFVENFVGKKRIWSQPSLIKVADLMIEHPITGSPEYSIFYCLNKMKMMKIDSLMIVDEKGMFLGCLYAESLVGAKASKKKAKDFMISDVITVRKEESIIELVKIVKENRLANIPVVNIDGTLAGLITRSSLVTALSQQFLEEDE